MIIRIKFRLRIIEVCHEKNSINGNFPTGNEAGVIFTDLKKI